MKETLATGARTTPQCWHAFAAKSIPIDWGALEGPRPSCTIVNGTGEPRGGCVTARGCQAVAAALRQRAGSRGRLGLLEDRDAGLCASGCIGKRDAETMDGGALMKFV